MGENIGRRCGENTDRRLISLYYIIDIKKRIAAVIKVEIINKIKNCHIKKRKRFLKGEVRYKLKRYVIPKEIVEKNNAIIKQYAASRKKKSVLILHPQQSVSEKGIQSEEIATRLFKNSRIEYAIIDNSLGCSIN
ncbi:hypothetical protein [Mucilaginibacter sp. L196]|uniref:hypothetical protein n=1 Tax=Mucilaginibacter sp. L196 TaxID=1641870 RepID=UPI00131E8367|nr:hypothetical protein [Mucilaginibacter sp. L196]